MVEDENNSENTNKNKVEAHPYHEFLELSFEQLFREPISLDGLDVDESVRQEDKEDYSFLLDLELEDLFRTPVSIKRFENDLERPAAAPKSMPAIDGSEHNVMLEQILSTQTPGYLTATKDLRIKNDDPEDKKEDKPVLPPPPVETPPLPVDPNAAHINETELFISEWVGYEGNLLANQNINPEEGMIFSVLGVMNQSEGDLDESNQRIQVETEYGRLSVNVFTGEYEYELFDASSIDDAQGTGHEEIAYEVMYNDESTETFYLNVIIDLNQAPQAFADEYTVDAVGGIDISDSNQGLLANDQDPDNSQDIQDLKFVTAVNGNPENIGEFFALPQGGLLRVNYDGTFVFDPNGDFDDLEPGQTQDIQFTYTMEDGEGLESTATVTFHVEGSAPPPLILVPETPHSMHTFVDIDKQPSKEKPLSIEDVFSDAHTIDPLELSPPLSLSYEQLHTELLFESNFEFG